MPIVYFCRKCSKNYSKEEYAQSKFCKECGSFLLANFRTHDQGIDSESAAANPNNSFKEKSALIRAAKNLRQRVGDSKEYEVVSETAKEEPKKPVYESWIWSSEYNDALHLEKRTDKTISRQKS